MNLWDFVKFIFSTPGPAAGPRATAPAPRPPQPPVKNPYEATGLLGLSAEELRRRAMRIRPWQTAWIGRVDTIPPISDERTAVIDRGLMLRGLLTREQLEEIHRVGDLWLQYHDTVRLAETTARRAADEAVEELRRRKAERKAEKKREAAERARLHREAVARRRAEDVVFLGRGVSSRLAHRESDREALATRGLPVLSTPAEVAAAMGLAVPTLRWLCFHGEAVERPHYVTFEVPKRSGGMRRLAAPQPMLMAAQRWVLREVLDRLPTEAPAHGFVRGRSTVTNAAPHCDRDVVVNLDLSDFFPTITFPRVRGLFESLGYSGAVATVLALVCTESPRARVEYAGVVYWVAEGPRALPQGAPTSPAISNQIARKLDRRLAGSAASMGWTYTRYADDMTFSAPDGKRSEIPLVLARARHVVEEEGFALNPKKGRVQRRAGRQLVTGIVVNSAPRLAREEVRRLRAILHGARRTGLAAQNREGRPHFEAWLRGKLAYLAMIDPPRGRAMLAELDAILAK
jgi:RNA-directed DNA polymerase